jgi:arylformamidase
MEFNFSYNGTAYQYDSQKYYDLSTPIRNGQHNVNAYYLEDPSFEAFRAGDFVGSVEQGGACNCESITFNAHGNGTHTECVGHISREVHTINQCLNHFTSMARVLTIHPTRKENGDHYIPVTALDGLDLAHTEAVIIRTTPNDNSKLEKRYSGTNPTYFDPLLTKKLADFNIQHFVVDVPSVDREEDGGTLLAHHAFWQYPSAPRLQATITELAFIPDAVEDGLYLMHLHIAAFESDASPSKPILYPLTLA